MQRYNKILRRSTFLYFYLPNGDLWRTQYDKFYIENRRELWNTALNFRARQK